MGGMQAEGMNAFKWRNCIGLHCNALEGMHEPPCQANAISTDGIANLLSRQMSNEGFTDFFNRKTCWKSQKIPNQKYSRDFDDHQVRPDCPRLTFEGVWSAQWFRGRS